MVRLFCRDCIFSIQLFDNISSGQGVSRAVQEWAALQGWHADKLKHYADKYGTGSANLQPAMLRCLSEGVIIGKVIYDAENGLIL